MKKIRKISLTALIFTIILSLITTIITYLTFTNFAFKTLIDIQFSINNALNLSGTISKFTFPIFIFLISFIYFNFSFISIYIFNLIIHLTHKSFYNTKLNQETVYVRDLPSYNCAIASYIIDGCVEPQKDIPPLIEELKSAKIITMKNNKYLVDAQALENLRQQPGNRSSVYLAECLMQNREVNYVTFTDKVVYDATELKLVTPSHLIYISIFIAFFTINYLAIIFYIIYFTINRRKASFIELNYRLTNTGKQEKERLIKLKRFIHHFSTLEDNNAKNNTIWGRYIPYAMILKEYDD